MSLDSFKLDPSSPSGVAWARDGRGFKAGDPCGYKDRSGYWVTHSAGVTYLMHRVVFELTHGWCPKVVDHRDLDKGNNHPDNLRAADHASNKWNAGVAAHNTSGVKGLSWNNKRACWVGRVCHDGSVSQKYSKDREVVERWLVDTRNKLHGEFANHGES